MGGYSVPLYGAGLEKDARRRARVRQNLQPLGVSFMVYGGYRLVSGIMALMAFHLFARGVFGDMPPFLRELAGSVLPVVALLAAVMAVLDVVVGYGLVTRRSWARVPAIVLGVLALVRVPFGTALGIYTLWVLAPRAAGEEFEQITASA